MPSALIDPFSLTADDICQILAKGKSLFPELDAARRDPSAVLATPAARVVLAEADETLKGIDLIPQTKYTASTLFKLTGDRKEYETPYFAKRRKLAAATLRLFFGRTDLRDTVQDYIWDICNEPTWVLPAHWTRAIDLFSAETAYNLAEMLAMLGDTLDPAVRARVRKEVETRIFEPYLNWYPSMSWYTTPMNWNGVCNSSVAATFLWLDPERKRAAKALEIALAGLKVFFDTAFEEDGTSTEGVGYWGYGLLNFIPLAEMLRAASNGAIDILAGERMRNIAGFPAKVMLSPGRYVAFSDSDELSAFNPGNIARLAGRTGEKSLLGLLATSHERDEWRFVMLLRNILWWDGKRPQSVTLEDEFLPAGATARFVAKTAQGTPLVVAIKAGHNAVPHNNNDIGSFVVHTGGETLLTDPGRGLYTRQYFSAERYQNIFCNSYGHSVPRIAGRLQSEGREWYGELSVPPGEKQAVVDFTHAYSVPDLASAHRQLRVEADGTVHLQDDFSFSGTPQQVEEAFVTWGDVTVKGNGAIIKGEKHSLTLTVDEPATAKLAVERLEKESKENKKPGVLKRLSFVLPEAATQRARIKIEVAEG